VMAHSTVEDTLRGLGKVAVAKSDEDPRVGCFDTALLGRRARR
jgi:hypothetical protein